MTQKILLSLCALICLALVGCGQEYGKVEQGRTVAYDKDKKTALVILDAGIDDKNPHYTVLPAHEFLMPLDPAEIGAEPKAGLRIKLDVEKNIITMYNPKTQKFEDLSFKLINKQQVPRDHVLVFDKEANKPRPFPAVDKDKREVTIYSGRQQLFVTIQLDEADFVRYTEKDWDAGDEVRIYFKEPGKALRFMNIAKTDIFKR